MFTFTNGTTHDFQFKMFAYVDDDLFDLPPEDRGMSLLQCTAVLCDKANKNKLSQAIFPFFSNHDCVL